MTSREIIEKIVEIDVELNKNKYEHHLTAERARSLRNKRDRLERKLYKQLREGESLLFFY